MSKYLIIEIQLLVCRGYVQENLYLFLTLFTNLFTPQITLRTKIELKQKFEICP